ncbi:hypothetical protein G9O61_00g012560 [Vairimorpha ceranae]|nr:hypothetical protein G9O61_00g012560 [Vairimorpha ceranae]
MQTFDELKNASPEAVTNKKNDGKEHDKAMKGENNKELYQELRLKKIADTIEYFLWIDFLTLFFDFISYFVYTTYFD